MNNYWPPENTPEFALFVKTLAYNADTIKTHEQLQSAMSLTDTMKREHEKLLMEKKAQEKPTAEIITFSEIAPKPITWAWKNHIPIGKLTLFAGDPDLGKSQGTLDVAARLSLGKDFPDGSPGLLGDTIILSSEDDPADTLRPRLDALEADVSRIHFMKGERQADGKLKPITLTKIDTFTNALIQIRRNGQECKLIIIDPLNGFMGGDKDGNSNEDVRSLLDALCDLAAHEELAILGIMHFNKASMNSAQYRVMGSQAWYAKARSAWAFVQHKETSRRLFLPMKNNLAPPGTGLQYTIQERDIGGILAPFISWEGPVDDNIHDILRQSKPERDRTSPEQEQILELFENNPQTTLTTGEIAAALNKDVSAISHQIHKLRNAGKVKPAGYGKWTLSDSLPIQSTQTAQSTQSTEKVLPFPSTVAEKELEIW
jgi:hypothetical protein